MVIIVKVAGIIPVTGWCGPDVCDFPSTVSYRRGEKWTCPRCGTTYRMTRDIPDRWWRNWFAPSGYWKVGLKDRLFGGKKNKW